MPLSAPYWPISASTGAKPPIPAYRPPIPAYSESRSATGPAGCPSGGTASGSHGPSLSPDLAHHLGPGRFTRFPVTLTRRHEARHGAQPDNARASGRWLPAGNRAHNSRICILIGPP